MYVIVATRTKDVLFVTDDPDAAEREYRALWEEDGIPVHFL